MKDDAYIARCKCGCGGIVYGAWALPDMLDQIATRMADLIRNGYPVYSVSMAEVQGHPWGCQKEAPDAEAK